jgi:hypothetical protein
VKHRPGIICTIVQTLRRRDNPVRMTVNGLNRGSALEFKESQGFFEVLVKPAPREREPWFLLRRVARDGGGPAGRVPGQRGYAVNSSVTSVRFTPRPF